MVTASAWGVLRIVAFVAAVVLLARWIAERRGAHLLPWLAPLAVLVTPALAVDLMRFGPGEPLMVAGLTIGLALGAAGLRMLLLGASSPSRRTAAVALLAGGYLIYLLGVYAKEASIFVLVFIPFFLAWLRPGWRAFIPRSRKGRFALGTYVVLLVAPLVHVAAHLALAIVGDERPYPAPEHSLWEKLWAAVGSVLLGQPRFLETWLWLFAVAGALAVAVAALRRRERAAWLLVGMLSTGFLMSALSLARGEIRSWYYIPWVVAVAVVAIYGLAHTTPRVQLAATIVVVVAGLPGTIGALPDWTRDEGQRAFAVQLAKGSVEAGCPTYLANFPIEQRVAIPIVFPFADARPTPSCAAGSRTAYLVARSGKALPLHFAALCTSGWQRLVDAENLTQFRCDSLRSNHVPDQIAASGHPETRVVRVRVTSRPPPAGTLFQAR
jgi:hypothetical protein